jgi:copper(I)-binding protein
MSRLLLLAAVLAALAGGCSEPAGPSVVISDVRVFAPVPGASAGVAYLTIRNRGDAPITIEGVRSPQFERVEMHETTITDGVSTMRSLDAVNVAAGATVEFRPGGKHLMLIGSGPAAVPGASIDIELAYGDGLMVVTATMQDRRSAK